MSAHFPAWRSTRWVRALAALALTMVVATGCTVLPNDTPPQSLGQFKRSPISFDPPRPVPGRSPDLLLRDFLRASAVPTSQHAAARLFLTNDANKDWTHHGSMRIVRRVDVNTVASPSSTELVLQVRARIVGDVDERGTFNSEVTTSTFEVEMVKRGKQWLISKFPNELLVDRDAFQATYEPQSLYYLDLSGERVVPDPRWLYSQNRNLPNTLMQMLKQRPAKQLDDVVASELPSSARITAETAAQGNGIDVQISNMTAGSEASLRRLAAQIIFTFERARVHGPYYLTINGVPLGTPKSKSWVPRDVQSFDPMYATRLHPVTLHAITSDGLMKVTNTLTPVPGPLGKAPAIRSASYSRGGKMVGAVVNPGDGPSSKQLAVVLGYNGTKPVVALRGDSFSQPTWTPDGREMWVVQNNQTVRRIMWQGDQSPKVSTIDTRKLGRNVEISAIRISPDGVRVAYISKGNIYTCVIAYLRDGSVELRNPQRIYLSTDEMVLSLAWRTANEIILGSTMSDRPVLMVSLDGASITPLGIRNITAPVSTVAANPSGIYVQDSRDVMRLEQGSEGFWQDVPALVSFSRSIPVLEG